MICDQGDALMKALRIQPVERFGVYQGSDGALVILPPDGKRIDPMPPPARCDAMA